MVQCDKWHFLSVQAATIAWPKHAIGLVWNSPVLVTSSWRSMVVKQFSGITLLIYVVGPTHWKLDARCLQLAQHFKSSSRYSADADALFGRSNGRKNGG